MGHSITRRLLVSNLVILAAFLGLAGTALDRAFRTSTETATQQRLQAHVYTLLTAAQEDQRGRMRLPEFLAAPAFNQPDSGLYAEVLGEDGAYRWRSGSLIGRGERLATAIAPGETRFHFEPTLAVFDQGVVWDDNAGTPLRYSVAVAMDSTTIQAEQAGFRGTLWRWLGGVTLLLLAAQILLARWGLQPLREMSAAVQRIESGQAEHIDGPVARELHGLSENLNSLIRQNLQRQERVRNALADLAHSMKTPLAVLRGATGHGADRALRDLITEQTQRIDEIVTYQRQRAAVAGTSSVTRPIALAPILRRLCASLDKVHRERALTCSLRVSDQLQLRADQGDLFELLGNLLENAYKHCSHRVQVGATADGQRLQIDVEDDGDGIPEQDVARILQRGQRADQRHPGEGIGLAVVSEIVHQYGGELAIGRSALGGALVSVVLPV
ncbi:MAG: GHKL domain-containing protein [Chromatiaceae bacterium]|nr:GHKL domain-containing protein [Chromatiaceae bacterium]